MTDEKLSIVELNKKVGRHALWEVRTHGVGNIKFGVVIKNVELLYGCPHFTIIPLNGEGQTRVRDNLYIIEK